MNNEKKHIVYTAKNIEQYLTGSMSNEEMHAIEKAALDDPLLADAIEGYNAVDNKEWNKVFAELRDKIAIADNTPVISISKNTFAQRWRVAAAILLIGCSIAIAYLFTSKNNAVKETLAANTGVKESNKTHNNQLATIDSTTYIADNKTPVTNSKKVLQLAEKNNRQPTEEKKTKATFKQDDQTASNDFVYRPSKQPTLASKDIIQTENYKSLAESAAKETISSNKEVQINSRNNVANEGNAADIKIADGNLNNSAAPSNQLNGLQLKGNNFFNAQVVDATNHPLPFAKIKTAAQKPIVADASGNFTIAAADTTLTVTVTAAGYLSKKYQLQNAAVPQKIMLDDDKIALQEITYTKRKSSSPKTVLIKEQNIKELEEEDDDIEPIIGWVEYNNYISQNLTVSDQLKNSNIHGVVEVFVKLKTNGNVSEVKIDKSLCAECDAEAIRLIKKGPRWDVKKNKVGKAKVKVQF